MVRVASAKFENLGQDNICAHSNKWLKQLIIVSHLEYMDMGTNASNVAWCEI